MFSPLKKSLQRGVTVMEILVISVVLSLLAALLYPALGLMREQSRTSQCLGRLRQAGALLTVAITERGGNFMAWYSGGQSGGQYWNTWLVDHRYLTHDSLRALSCPSMSYPAENSAVSGRHFGLYLADTANHLVDMRGEEGELKGRAYRINLRTIASPASTIFMADSVASNGELSIRIFRSDSSAFASGAFHQRHQKRVNLFFYDGHAESADAGRLKALGVKRIYDHQLQARNIP